MIVLSRKRIAFLIGSVWVAVLVFSVGMHLTPQQTIQTMSLPVTNKVIVVDAGHGIPDEREYLLTLIDNN